MTIGDLEKVLVVTLTGMTVEEFNAEAKKWIKTARHPRWNRAYTELVYQPMLEVLRYLRDNAYKTYIVTGGGQDFVRVYAEKVYGHPARASGTSATCECEDSDFQGMMSEIRGIMICAGRTTRWSTT